MPTAQRSKVLKPDKIAIVGGAEYDHFDGPEGLDIRVPRDDVYRTCSVCGGDPLPGRAPNRDVAGRWCQPVRELPHQADQQHPFRIRACRQPWNR